MDHFEVEQDFPTIGRRTMLLNARKVFYQGDLNTTLLLAIEDITDRRVAERLLHSLSEQKDMLLSEMSHRVANSLQIIASILLLKARSVQSEETRGHLEDAHRRVMSVASLQQHLKATGKGEEIEVGAYLSKLCEALVRLDGPGETSDYLESGGGPGTVQSEQAVSIGLIVTELVMNALKYAFPVDMTAGHVVVGYKVNGTEWTLSVSDNGGGMRKSSAKTSRALARRWLKRWPSSLKRKSKLRAAKQGTVVSNHPALKFEYIRVGVFYPLHMAGNQLCREHAEGNAVSAKTQHGIATRQFPDRANGWKPCWAFTKTAGPSVIRFEIDVRENAFCFSCNRCDFSRYQSCPAKHHRKTVHLHRRRSPGPARVVLM